MAVSSGSDKWIYILRVIVLCVNPKTQNETNRDTEKLMTAVIHSFQIYWLISYNERNLISETSFNIGLTSILISSFGSRSKKF